jgi:hypothetical protein
LAAEAMRRRLFYFNIYSKILFRNASIEKLQLGVIRRPAILLNRLLRALLLSSLSA